MLPLAGNARAKMANLHDGFVKLFCRRPPPRHRRRDRGAQDSELILPITMAIEHHLTVDQLAHTITIYRR